MTDSEILTVLKLDLKISVNSYDALLNECIATAKTQIGIEGITLAQATSVADCALIRMYAAYLYRSREEDKGMPVSLRRALNNRLLHEKGAVLYG